MADVKKLGVFWGQTGITLSELRNDVPAGSAEVSFSSFDGAAGVDSVSEDARLLELLQRNYRNAGFSCVDAVLSLPSRDVVLRWFLIPPVRAGEIDGVVNFEVRKYLPFALEDFFYAYRSISQSTREGRKIGILFAGIRKEAYLRYSRVISQAGMNVRISEPACLSIFRALVHKKIIVGTAPVAVLRVESGYGEILVASGGVVSFVRDFSCDVPVEPAGSTLDRSSMVREKLFNEVRLSMDFFQRQFQLEPKRIIFLASQEELVFFASLKEEIGVSVLPVDVTALSGGGGGIGALGAMGAALSGRVAAVSDLNLSEKDPDRPQASATGSILAAKWSMLVPVVAGILSACILLGIWLMTGGVIAARQSEVSALRERLGEFGDVTLEDILARRDRAAGLLRAFEKIPLQTRVAEMIVGIVQNFPENLWVEKISVVFRHEGTGGDSGGDSEAEGTGGKTALPALDTSLAMTFDVQMFAGRDKNMVFDRANRMLQSFRGDPRVLAYFRSVDMSGVETLPVKDSSVARFTLTFSN